MRALERRQAIIEYLCEVRKTTLENLAFEFNVSTRTIRTDINDLSLSYPIYTVCGRQNGGVYISDDYHLGKKYLSNEEQSLLKKLSTNASTEDRKIIESIIRRFGIMNKRK